MSDSADDLDVTMNLTDGKLHASPASPLSPSVAGASQPCVPLPGTRPACLCPDYSTETFINLADGKLNGQKAFMTGALKVKGNVMLAVSAEAAFPIISFT